MGDASRASAESGVIARMSADRETSIAIVPSATLPLGPFRGGIAWEVGAHVTRAAVDVRAPHGRARRAGDDATSKCCMKSRIGGAWRGVRATSG